MVLFDCSERQREFAFTGLPYAQRHAIDVRHHILPAHGSIGEACKAIKSEVGCIAESRQKWVVLPTQVRSGEYCLLKSEVGCIA